jgi:hypothetical protein
MPGMASCAPLMTTRSAWRQPRADDPQAVDQRAEHDRLGRQAAVAATTVTTLRAWSV